jgi:WD repeat-containing protein 35
MKVGLNSTATLMSLIDINGEFRLYNFEDQQNSMVLTYNEALDKKDVHQVKWAEDNPNMLCILEKNKLVFIKNGVEEEPVAFIG